MTSFCTVILKFDTFNLVDVEGNGYTFKRNNSAKVLLPPLRKVVYSKRIEWTLFQKGFIEQTFFFFFFRRDLVCRKANSNVQNDRKSTKCIKFH